MLAWQEERRRWVRGCIKITESVHAYEFQVLISLLFFWSAACRYSCSQKWYPLTIITRPYRGLSYFTPWVEILADAHHIFCRGDFSARKNVLRSLRFHSSQGGLFCVSLFVSFLEPEWNTRDSKVRSFWSSFSCLVSLSLQSLGEASHLYIRRLSNINQFPRSRVSYFPLASFRDVPTNTGYTWQGDWPQKP